MKTVYQTPEVRIVEMKVQNALMLATSETTVSGGDGGWVKENPVSRDRQDYNVWNDDWSN